MSRDEARAFLLAAPRTAKIATVHADGRPHVAPVWFDLAYVIVEGTVALSEDLGEVRAWATRIAARYMGRMRAKTFGERNGVPGEVLVRVTPKRIIGQSGVAD